MAQNQNGYNSYGYQGYQQEYQPSDYSQQLQQQSDNFVPQTPIQPSQPPIPNQAPPSNSNLGLSGLAVAGFVIGIVGIATSFMPIINNVSFFLGLLGFILAVIGLAGINKGKNRGRGMAIAGIILNIATVVIVLASQAFYVSVIDSMGDSIRAKPAASSTPTASSPAASSTDGTGDTQTDTATAAESSSTPALDSAYAVSIDSATLMTGRDGKLIAVVNYTFTNNSNKATSFAAATHAQAFQNGVELESTYDSTIFDWNTQTKDVKTGASLAVQDGFVVTDKSPITIEVKELWDFNQTLLAEKAFTVQ